MANKYTAFEVVITAIIVKDSPPSHKATARELRYLITRRSMQKRRFPGMWTVPGGHLEPEDYMSFPKDTEHYWYNVLEKALERELEEEVGVKIKNVRYVTSLATVMQDELSGGEKVGSIVISCLADYVSGEVKLQEDETDKFEWVTLEEAKNYELLDGIYDELAMAENLLKTGKIGNWKRN